LKEIAVIGRKNGCRLKWAGVFCFILISGFSQAQTWSFELWHEGKIVLAEGDTLKGLVKYDLQQDLVQYTYQNSQPEAYTARKVLYFEIFDELIHRYRRFFTLPFSTSPGYKTPIFFELLEEGKMTLLCREFLEYKSQSSMYMSYSRMVLSYKYFFLLENGEIEESIIVRKNDLLDRMGKRADEVEKYMKTNRLRVEDRQDLVRIVDYYNSLFGI
jgi:hypothetical protein